VNAGAQHAGDYRPLRGRTGDRPSAIGQRRKLAAPHESLDSLQRFAEGEP
jgi:hypothetical protein